MVLLTAGRQWLIESMEMEGWEKWEPLYTDCLIGLEASIQGKWLWTMN